MSHQLVNLNPDLKRLRDEGFSISVSNGYVIVRDIPYLNSIGMLKWGVLASNTRMPDPQRIELQDHQVLWSGEWPCHIDHREINRLRGGPANVVISEELTADFSFSNKPVNGPPLGYVDFHDKIVSYCRIVCGPAEAKCNVTPRNFNEYKSDEPDSPLNFIDTMSSRAEIVDLSKKFENEIVGIIGLGGTGSYVLDYLAKTPVRQIHLFDGDKFHLHNAYRAPGGFSASDFGQMKADLFASRYADFRKQIVAHTWYVSEDQHEFLERCSFVFVCVDKGPARHEIIGILERLGKPFADVGMGLKKLNGSLQGLIRLVFATPEQLPAIREARVFPKKDAADDLYASNIQICELNALNACLAVVRYKRHLGFYHERMPHNYSLWNVASDKNSTESL